jgi:hypothetical protein
MNVALAVHSVNCQNELGHVEASVFFRKDIFHDQQIHHISTWQELHDKIQKHFILKIKRTRLGVKTETVAEWCGIEARTWKE